MRQQRCGVQVEAEQLGDGEAFAEVGILAAVVLAALGGAEELDGLQPGVHHELQRDPHHRTVSDLAHPVVFGVRRRDQPAGDGCRLVGFQTSPMLYKLSDLGPQPSCGVHNHSSQVQSNLGGRPRNLGDDQPTEIRPPGPMAARDLKPLPLDLDRR